MNSAISCCTSACRSLRSRRMTPQASKLATTAHNAPADATPIARVMLQEAGCLTNSTAQSIDFEAAQMGNGPIQCQISNKFIFLLILGIELPSLLKGVDAVTVSKAKEKSGCWAGNSAVLYATRTTFGNALSLIISSSFLSFSHNDLHLICTIFQLAVQTRQIWRRF